jgi:hypothetical protein
VAASNAWAASSTTTTSNTCDWWCAHAKTGSVLVTVHTRVCF